MFDGLLALAVPDAVAEAIADRFVAVEAVTWGDVRDAGIAGRDVVRLRKRISGDAKVGRRGVHAADWLQERRLATGDALVFVFRGVTLTGRSGGYSTPSAVGTSRAVRAVGVVPPPLRSPSPSPSPSFTPSRHLLLQHFIQTPAPPLSLPL